jgi:uncharacterized RDD family membrane protein YckC
MSWYYASGGERHGPVSEEEFHDLVRRGVIAPDALVWTSGMSDWRRLSEVLPELPLPAAGSSGDRGVGRLPAAATTFTGARVADVGLAPHYAGFWIRVLARLIDGVLLWVAAQIFAGLLVAVLIPDALGALSIEPGVEPTAEQLTTLLAVLGLVMVSSLVTGLVYDLIFLRGWSATPGKLLLGLRVRMADGSPLSIGRIIGRHLAVSLSGFTFGVGYLMVAFDAEKRGLHDHLCATRVVRQR